MIVKVYQKPVLLEDINSTMTMMQLNSSRSATQRKRESLELSWKGWITRIYSWISAKTM